MANNKTVESKILGQTPDRRYYTIIPNMLDDLGLSPYAIRLYLRLKRRAGDNGKCFENSQHLAEGCRMSKTQISRSKAALVKADLITIKKRFLGHGHFPGHLITITDIWKRNVEYYDTGIPVSGGDASCSFDCPRPVPQVGLKKNPIKKYQKGKILNKDQPSDTFSPKSEAKSASVFDETGGSGDLSRHQTIIDIKEITGFWPHKVARSRIVNTFPYGLDRDRARNALERWVLKGFNPTNLDWLFNWYRTGYYYEHPKDNERWDEIQEGRKP
jgi:hypothetical protein